MKLVKSNALDFNYQLNGTESVDVNSQGTIVSDEVAAQLAKTFPFVSVEDVDTVNGEVLETPEEVIVEEPEVADEIVAEEPVLEEVSEPVVEEVVEEVVAEEKPKRGRGKNK